MIEIKIYRLMDDCRIDLVMTGSDGVVGTRVNWQGPLDERDVLGELSHHLVNALSAADRVMGEVHAELLFGS